MVYISMILFVAFPLFFGLFFVFGLAIFPAMQERKIKKLRKSYGICSIENYPIEEYSLRIEYATVDLMEYLDRPNVKPQTKGGGNLCVLHELFSYLVRLEGFGERMSRADKQVVLFLGESMAAALSEDKDIATMGPKNLQPIYKVAAQLEGIYSRYSENSLTALDVALSGIAGSISHIKQYDNILIEAINVVGKDSDIGRVLSKLQGREDNLTATQRGMVALVAGKLSDLIQDEELEEDNSELSGEINDALRRLGNLVASAEVKQVENACQTFRAINSQLEIHGIN